VDYSYPFDPLDVAAFQVLDAFICVFNLSLPALASWRLGWRGAVAASIVTWGDPLLEHRIFDLVFPGACEGMDHLGWALWLLYGWPVSLGYALAVWIILRTVGVAWQAPRAPPRHPDGERARSRLARLMEPALDKVPPSDEA